MKLSFDTIKSITTGAVRVWEEDSNVHFGKCTQKQVDAWYKIEHILGERAECTTGVRLDFYTNSSTFSFTAASGNKFEIYVNDLMLYNIKKDDLKDGSYSIKLDGKENRITLILPSHELGIISAVEIDDGATVRPVDYDCKMMFIGDSITQGWDSGYDSLSYAYRVSRFFNADSVIHGVGGGMFHETIFDEDVPYDPDIVVIAFGTNDWGRFKSLDALKEQASKFLGAIAKKYAGKKIFALSPIWRANEETEVRATGTFNEVCEAVKGEINNAGIILIDGLTLVPHHSDFFADLYLHPNALGFGIYAENLIKQMQKYL